jgi:parallel beta-helix repeat protein
VDNSDWAIELTNSNGNTFQNNWLQENTYGVFMAFSSTNTLYRNNFVNNVMQASAGTGSNTWSSGGQGNYWSDYKGTDANHNGIGDTPYLISPIGQDNYPLMTTWSEHDIAVTSVTSSTNQANPGEVVTITVKVRNNDNISSTETFTVTAKYNNTVIGTQQVNLAQGATSIRTFNWNTTGAAPGSYTIKAEASTVTDELNTDNNSLTDGTVRIKEPFIGDINGDGTINQQDLILLQQAYGSTPGAPNWNQGAADLNKDNIVDDQDLHLLSRNYGKTS